MFENKLSDTKAEYNILKEIENSFANDFNLTPCLGAELEFYLLDNYSEFQLLELEIKTNIKIKKEKGNNQYEIEIPPSIDIASYPNIIRNLRELIIEESKKLNIEANFQSKPFANDYGNSMHIHFNFLEDTNAEKYAEILCHYLPSTIDAFLPEKEDYKRLDSKFMAPTHISYGGNNRTTLIRIPDSLPRRLEHRLAAASSDPFKVIYTILSSINSGLKHPEQISKLGKTYGNAHDQQYDLISIA